MDRQWERGQDRTYHTPDIDTFRAFPNVKITPVFETVELQNTLCLFSLKYGAIAVRVNSWSSPLAVEEASLG